MVSVHGICIWTHFHFLFVFLSFRADLVVNSFLDPSKQGKAVIPKEINNYHKDSFGIFSTEKKKFNHFWLFKVDECYKNLYLVIL